MKIQNEDSSINSDSKKVFSSTVFENSTLNSLILYTSLQ